MQYEYTNIASHISLWIDYKTNIVHVSWFVSQRLRAEQRNTANDPENKHCCNCITIRFQMSPGCPRWTNEILSWASPEKQSWTTHIQSVTLSAGNNLICTGHSKHIHLSLYDSSIIEATQISPNQMMDAEGFCSVMLWMVKIGFLIYKWVRHTVFYCHILQSCK